jgi:hypothetical protein
MHLLKENPLFSKQEHLAYGFPVRIELVFERNTACSWRFSSVRKEHFVTKAYSADLKKHMYLWKEYHLCWKLEHIVHCLPVRIEIVFERNTACQWGFSRGITAHYDPNRPIQLSWLDTCISRKKTIYSWKWSIKHVVFMWELSYFSKGILPACQGFQVGDMHIYFKIHLFSWVEETHVALEGKASLLEAGTCNTLFPCENWVSFWKEYCLPISVFKVEKCSFCSK